MAGVMDSYKPPYEAGPFSISLHNHPILLSPIMLTVSRDLKSSVLVLALVLVPIVVLVVAVAVALTCSEFWSSRPGASCFGRRTRDQRSGNSLAGPRNSDSTDASGETSGSSFTPLDYEEPAIPREHV